MPGPDSTPGAAPGNDSNPGPTAASEPHPTTAAIPIAPGNQQQPHKPVLGVPPEVPPRPTQRGASAPDPRTTKGRAPGESRGPALRPAVAYDYAVVSCRPRR
ncbi:hypothetical protein GCM10020367_16620 [Streptomyces sannanensis]|uniref:Uncharacterized protein n=1 Tax=Streptomyces sannanensis TaxID=285536 RepID=A0ABP6S7T1_9ACTN